MKTHTDRSIPQDFFILSEKKTTRKPLISWQLREVFSSVVYYWKNLLSEMFSI